MDRPNRNRPNRRSSCPGVRPAVCPGVRPAVRVSAGRFTDAPNARPDDVGDSSGCGTYRPAAVRRARRTGSRISVATRRHDRPAPVGSVNECRRAAVRAAQRKIRRHARNRRRSHVDTPATTLDDPEPDDPEPDDPSITLHNIHYAIYRRMRDGGKDGADDGWTPPSARHVIPLVRPPFPSLFRLPLEILVLRDAFRTFRPLPSKHGGRQKRKNGVPKESAESSQEQDRRDRRHGPDRHR